MSLPIRNSQGGGSGSAVDFNNLIAVLTDTGGATQQWVVPAGVRHIRTVTVGEGGDSTAGSALARSGAGGGAGGVKEAFKEVTPATSINYAVGGAQSWIFSPAEAFANAGANANGQTGGLGGTAGGTLPGFAVKGGDGQNGKRLISTLTLKTSSTGGDGGDNDLAGTAKGGIDSGGNGINGYFPGGGASGGGADALSLSAGTAATGALGVIYIYASARVAPSGGGGGGSSECNCFLSTTSLKAASGFLAGQMAETLNHSTVGDSWGAKYIAIADATHTDGVGGWVEGANYLQGTGVQWELLTDDHGRYSLAQMGLYNGVDATTRLNNLNGSIHIQNAYAPAGTLILDGDVVLDPTTFSWVGEGRTTVIDCSGGGSLFFQKALSALPALSADMVKYDNLTNFSAVHGLSEDDVFLVWNPNDGSFNSYRANYYDGHMARVAAVTSTTQVRTFGSYPDTYLQTNPGLDDPNEMYKLEGYNAWFEGFNIVPRATASASLGFQGYAGLDIHNVSCDRGTLDTGIAISICYDFRITLATATAMAGNAYPYVIGNSQKGEITGYKGYSTRHIIGFGGAAITGAVPCRDVMISNCNFENDRVGLTPAADVHGNCDGFTYSNCYFDSSAVLSGRGHTFHNCRVKAAGCRAFFGSEPVGGVYRFVDCEIIAHGLPVGSIGTFHLPINNLKEDAELHIVDCLITNEATGVVPNWYLVSYSIGTSIIDHRITTVIGGKTVVRGASPAQVVRIVGDAALGTSTAGFRTKIEDDFDCPPTSLVGASNPANIAKGAHLMTLPRQHQQADVDVRAVDVASVYVSGFLVYPWKYPRQPNVAHGFEGRTAALYDPVSGGAPYDNPITYVYVNDFQNSRAMIRLQNVNNLAFTRDADITIWSQAFMKEW